MKTVGGRLTWPPRRHQDASETTQRCPQEASRRFKDRPTNQTNNWFILFLHIRFSGHLGSSWCCLGSPGLNLAHAGSLWPTLGSLWLAVVRRGGRGPHWSTRSGLHVAPRSVCQPSRGTRMPGVVLLSSLGAARNHAASAVRVAAPHRARPPSQVLPCGARHLRAVAHGAASSQFRRW